MIIGPKYKIARRLNAPVFEKTQTQKYALSAARKTKKGKGGPRQRTAFGEQMAEKQKARFTYLLTEKAFSNYVRKAMDSKDNTVPALFSLLERRLDNVVYRMGLATTRSGARQMVSHGHIGVNGKKVTIPSFAVSVGDKIDVRPNSQKKPLFANATEKMKNITAPNWIKADAEKVHAEILSLPSLAHKTDTIFDLNTVIEFYSR
ncbi:MAG TPA: 30S ribosomal protein S4 [Candidatus Nanoarchaeia archaeon]|nr:30S ribosomal protein S4 [Candidatus Nanoarchaeia archaeon]